MILCLIGLLVATQAFPHPEVEQEQQKEQQVNVVEDADEDVMVDAELAKTSGLSCDGPVTKIGKVYILNPTKDYAYCAVSDSTIAKASVSLNSNNNICIWTQYECTGSNDAGTTFTFFGHNDGTGPKKFLAADAQVFQTEVVNRKVDAGHFYRVQQSSGGLVQLKNKSTGQFISDEGLAMGLGFAGTFKLCDTTHSLSSC